MPLSQFALLPCWLFALLQRPLLTSHHRFVSALFTARGAEGWSSGDEDSGDSEDERYATETAGGEQKRPPKKLKRRQVERQQKRQQQAALEQKEQQAPSETKQDSASTRLRSAAFANRRRLRDSLRAQWTVRAKDDRPFTGYVRARLRRRLDAVFAEQHRSACAAAASSVAASSTASAAAGSAGAASVVDSADAGSAGAAGAGATSTIASGLAAAAADGVGAGTAASSGGGGVSVWLPPMLVSLIIDYVL